MSREDFVSTTPILDDWHQDKALIPVVLDAFVKRLVESFGNRLQRVILFGSVARGENDPADIDVCIVLKDYRGQGDPRRRKIVEIAGDIDMNVGDCKTYLAPFVCSPERYLSDVEPVFINIQEEGRVLYDE